MNSFPDGGHCCFSADGVGCHEEENKREGKAEEEEEEEDKAFPTAALDSSAERSNDKDGGGDGGGDTVLGLLFHNTRLPWTDWGTLQHEAALGCRVHWLEWLVAFSPAWEPPFLVFDCGRAGEFVGGALGVDELWGGVWHSSSSSPSAVAREPGGDGDELVRSAGRSGGGNGAVAVDDDRVKEDQHVAGGGSSSRDASRAPLGTLPLGRATSFRRRRPGDEDDDDDDNDGTSAAGCPVCHAQKRTIGLGCASTLLSAFCAAVLLWMFGNAEQGLSLVRCAGLPKEFHILECF